jgi:hypothetical protein
VESGIEHGGDNGVAQHVRVHARYGDSCDGCQRTKSTGGGVTVHASPCTVAQDRVGVAPVHRAVDGTANRQR